MEEAKPRTIGPIEEMNVPADARKGGGQLGIAERADDREHPARQPRQKQARLVRGCPGHQRRCAEYPGAYDDSDDER
jgi:hypothetical protein